MIAASEIFETHSAPGQFECFESHDRDETEAFATSLFCPHEFRLARREKALAARIAAASLSNLSMASIRFGANVCVDPGTLDDFYLVQAVIGGSVDVLSGKQRCFSTPGIATVVSPNQATRMLWDRDAHFLSLKIAKPALEAQLSNLIARPVEEPLVFDLKLDLRQDKTKTWQSAVDTLYNLLRYTDWSPGDSHDVETLERWIICALLHTQPHNYSALVHNDEPVNWPHCLRKAVRFIDTNFRRALSGNQIAEAAGVSERKLRADFRKYLGVTAKQYQRRRRLQFVRSALCNASPETSITNLFADAGVQHFGRFSGHYKKEYGELPSFTLANNRAKCSR